MQVSTESSFSPEAIDAMRALGYQLGNRLSTAVVLFHSAIADQLGLNVTDWKCASVLFQLGPCNPGLLAEKTGMSSAAITQVIDRLERAGIVQRRHDTRDRRKVVVHPVDNPEFQEKLRSIFMDLGESMTKVMAQYSFEQLQTILDFVGKTCDVLEAETKKLRNRP